MPPQGGLLRLAMITPSSLHQRRQVRHGPSRAVSGLFTGGLLPLGTSGNAARPRHAVAPQAAAWQLSLGAFAVLRLLVVAC